MLKFLYVQAAIHISAHVRDSAESDHVSQCRQVLCRIREGAHANLRLVAWCVLSRSDIILLLSVASHTSHCPPIAIRPSLEYVYTLTRAPTTRPAWPAHSRTRPKATSHSPIRPRRSTRLPQHHNRHLRRIFHSSRWTATRIWSINSIRLTAILAMRSLPRPPRIQRSCRATRLP